MCKCREATATRSKRSAALEDSSPFKGEVRRGMGSMFLPRHRTPSPPNPPLEGEGVFYPFFPVLLRPAPDGRLSPRASRLPSHLRLYIQPHDRSRQLRPHG